MYSSLVYSGSPENVRAVMVDGVWLYRDGLHKTLDEQEAMADARRELRKLLGRM
jgi:cytosine/adenosine deaminase-related metal-dependent hydrolase